MSFNIFLNNTWITLKIRQLLTFQRAPFFLETVEFDLLLCFTLLTSRALVVLSQSKSGMR
jgi:hypothetical protein